ncbi:hypothetical protein [Fluviispira sanaruensis]|nr:hypothetical protein [Fluviispira sanaruensis]
MKKQKNYNLNDELENLEITDELLKDSAWIPPKNGGKAIGKRISIVLPVDLIKTLIALGKEKGVSYQTLARVLLLEKIEELKKR